jgi:hypothetical protein
VFVPPSDAEAKELCSSGTSVGWATGACSLGVDAESGLESSLQGANPVGALRGPDAWPFHGDHSEARMCESEHDSLEAWEFGTVSL